MSKRTDENKRLQFTARVHRQHSSLVVTIPKGICKELDIQRGDIAMFVTEPGVGAAVIVNINTRGYENGKDARNPDREDQGRRA